eukprot:scaffold9180_cov35-Tisochrysis_lutea.AAC.1
MRRWDCHLRLPPLSPPPTPLLSATHRLPALSLLSLSLSLPAGRSSTRTKCIVYNFNRESRGITDDREGREREQPPFIYEYLPVPQLLSPAFALSVVSAAARRGPGQLLSPLRSESRPRTAPPPAMHTRRLRSVCVMRHANQQPINQWEIGGPTAR